MGDEVTLDDMTADPSLLTNANLRAAVNRHAREQRVWGGCPVPSRFAELSVEPRYPWQGLNNFKIEDSQDAEERQAELKKELDLLNEEIKAWGEGVTGMAALDLRRRDEWTDEEKARYKRMMQRAWAACTKDVNQWYSQSRRQWVFIYRIGRRTFHATRPRYHHASRLEMTMTTMGVAGEVYDIKAELVAQRMLRRMIGGHRFRQYVLTGAFLETSQRSKVVYLFRRCRPTVAMRHTADGSDMFGLCALCLHPIGYYQSSWCGALVPTDDVLAHLLMMRGDERKFWAHSNQHALWRPEAGV